MPLTSFIDRSQMIFILGTFKGFLQLIFVILLVVSTLNSSYWVQLKSFWQRKGALFYKDFLSIDVCYLDHQSECPILILSTGSANQVKQVLQEFGYSFFRKFCRLDHPLKVRDQVLNFKRLNFLEVSKLILIEESTFYWSFDDLFELDEFQFGLGNSASLGSGKYYFLNMVEFRSLLEKRLLVKG